MGTPASRAGAKRNLRPADRAEHADPQVRDVVRERNAGTDRRIRGSSSICPTVP